MKRCKIEIEVQVSGVTLHFTFSADVALVDEGIGWNVFHGSGSFHHEWIPEIVSEIDIEAVSENGARIDFDHDEFALAYALEYLEENRESIENKIVEEWM